MKKLTTGQASGEDIVLDFGKVLGQSVAFGTVAGRCSAAQASALRQARHDKVHTRFGLTWKEFCPRHLKMSGTQADKIIRLFEEFGPAYFLHTQSVRISPDTYRTIAPFIMDTELHVDGQVLEFNSANVQKAAKSIRESRRALLPPEEPDAEPALLDRIAALDRRLTGEIAEFRELSKAARKVQPSPLYRSNFRRTLNRLCSELTRVSLENGIV